LCAIDPATANSLCFCGWISLLCAEPRFRSPGVIGKCQFARQWVLSRPPNNGACAVTCVTPRGLPQAQVT